MTAEVARVFVAGGPRPVRVRHEINGRQWLLDLDASQTAIGGQDAPTTGSVEGESR
ncbi:hypothetical protein [Streptomyces acidicola]|uniref:hypothetical protein n=1 Tax=Streptomyces acidicola TaxID=2596892 RepID=UPI00380643D5